MDLAHYLEIEDWVDAEGGIGAILRYPDRVGVKVPAILRNGSAISFSTTEPERCPHGTNQKT